MQIRHVCKMHNGLQSLFFQTIKSTSGPDLLRILRLTPGQLHELYGFLPTPLQRSWRPWLTLPLLKLNTCAQWSALVTSQRSAHRTMTNIFDFMTYNYIHVQPRAHNFIEEE